MVIAEHLPRTLRAVSGAVKRRLYPAWARQWQFWAVLGTSAILRLFAIGRSPFGSDDALLFLEASRAIHDHLLPGTGIYNSVLALNMPLYSFITLPFATNPQAMSVVTALANIAAVAGWYVFVQRFFDRWAALIAGLLFATACYDTYMSLFVWQQTILAPLTVAFFWTAYRGALERGRHWLAPHVLVLAALIQIYPVMAALLPLTLIALWFGRRAITWADASVACVGTIVLYLPTLLFEVASHGYDLPIYAAYLRAPKQTDTQVFEALAQALGPRPADFFGVGTTYFQSADRFAWLTPALMALWLVSTLWLLCSLAAPLIPLLRPRPLRAFPLGALYRQISRPEWLGKAMLVVWPLALVAITLRHSSTVYVHYVFEITPTIYCAIALFLTRFPRQLGALLPRPPLSLPTGPGRYEWARRQLPRALSGAPGWLGLGVGLLIVVSQTVLTSLFVFTLGTGQATAGSWGATPTLGYMRVMDAANGWAKRLHSRTVLLVADPGDPYMGLYWAQRENDLALAGSPFWSSAVETDCAIAPPGAASGIVLTLTDQGLALRQVLLQGGARLLQRVPVARGTTYAVYALAPDPSPAPVQATLNGELALRSAFVAAAGSGLPARLVTIWTVLQASPSTSSVAQYHFHFLFHQGGQTADAQSSCMPGGWLAGERVTVVTALPAGLDPTRPLAPRVIVSRDTHLWYRPRLGALVLDTAKELVVNSVVLPPGIALGGGIAHPDQAALDRCTVPIVLTA